jgi:hypothetical protein
MKVYIGQTRSRKLIRSLEYFGFGEMTVREEVPPRRKPWAFDNGAYKDWTAKPSRPFNEVKFLKALEQAKTADFIVVPDVVAGGLQSLAFSEVWFPRLDGFTRYLALQDGMLPKHIAPIVAKYDGLFLGGTLGWKLATIRTWRNVTKRWGKPLHVGRVGTKRRAQLCRRLGVDSIDSCLPLWSTGNLVDFLEGVYGPLNEIQGVGDLPDDSG